MKEWYSLIIGIDFDGCIATHDFPDIGELVPGAVDVIRELIDAGHRPVLWTCRSNYQLLEAIEFTQRAIGPGYKLHGFNSNRLGDEYPGSPKLYADQYIDDKGVGCPLVHGVHERPYVDWYAVRELFRAEGVLP